MFYDELGIAVEYGVSKTGILYYFLFSLMIFPFYAIIDILFLNILTYYQNCDFITCLESWKNRYNSRKVLWKNHDNDIDKSLPKPMVSLDQMCFSPQYYFMISFQSSCVMLVVIGLVGVLKRNYNPWTDKAGLLFWGANLLLMVFLTQVAKFFAQAGGLWVPKTESKRQRSTLAKIFKNFFGFRKEPDLKQKPQRKNSSRVTQRKTLVKHNTLRGRGQPHRVVGMTLKIDQRVFEVQNDIILQEKRMQNLETTLFSDPKFKLMFLQTQIDWIRANINAILTPRTQVMHRDVILNGFTRVYGSIELKGDMFKKKTLNEEGHFGKQDYECTWSMMSSTKKSKTTKIISFWLSHVRILMEAKSQVGRLIERQIQEQCCFCDSREGLRCESIESIRDLFFRDYIPMVSGEFSLASLSWVVTHWQDYFLANATFRTICYTCSSEIEAQYLSTPASPLRQSLNNSQTTRENFFPETKLKS